MKCRLLNFLGVLSLAAFAALSAAWVVGRDRFYGGSHGTPARYTMMGVGPSGLYFFASRHDDAAQANRFTGWHWLSTPPPSVWERHRWLGFRGDVARQDTSGVRGPLGVPTQIRTLVVPYWALLAATSILPLLWAGRARRRRRFKPGHCSSCGYDLRASPGRCPECGNDQPAPRGRGGTD